MDEGLQMDPEGNEVVEITATTGASCTATLDESYIVLTPWQIMQRY